MLSHFSLGGGCFWNKLSRTEPGHKEVEKFGNPKDYRNKIEQDLRGLTSKSEAQLEHKAQEDKSWNNTGSSGRHCLVNARTTNVKMSIKKEGSIKFSISGDSLEEEEEPGASGRITEQIPEHREEDQGTHVKNFILSWLLQWQ